MKASFIFKQFIVFLLMVTLLTHYAFADEKQFSDRKSVQQFMDEMVKDYHFKKEYLVQLFNQVHPRKKVINNITHTKEKQLTWGEYSKIFITPERINDGVKFWQTHQKALAKAYHVYGVDPSVIVAIIGVESFYGKNSGNYRVIDSLSTLAFNYPERTKFFTNELKEYLLLSREYQFDPLTIKGSYAGAIGQGQFMPSSYRKYSTHYGKTTQKTFDDANDVILNIANYFKQNGWCKNQLALIPAKVHGNTYQNLEINSLKPNLTFEILKKYGVSPLKAYHAKPGEKASLIVLETQKDQKNYWLGFTNFYVISSYNPRLNYTMAVYQLSREIKKQYAQTT